MSLFLLVQVGNPIKWWRNETEPAQLCSSYLNLLAEFRRTNCYLSTTNPFEVQFGQPMLWFYETLMYIKLREPIAQLTLFGEVTFTSILWSLQVFKIYKPSIQKTKFVPKIKHEALMFQPLFGSVVVCYLIHCGSEHESKTNQMIQAHLNLGHGKMKSQHLNLSTWILSEERYLVKQLETDQSRKKRSLTEPRPRKVTKQI